MTAAVPFFLFREGFLHNRVINGYDVIAMEFPLGFFARWIFAQYHTLPLWMPGIMTGLPLIDSYNLAYFYPTNLFYMAAGVPLHLTFTIDIILHMLLSGAGMLLFARSCGLNGWGAIFSAAVFMLSGGMVSFVYAGHVQHIKAVSYIPVIFYVIKRAMDGGKAGWFITYGLGLALQVLVIGVQVAVYTFAATAVFALFYPVFNAGAGRDPWKKAGFFAAACVFAALFSAPQLFAYAKYAGEPWRNTAAAGYFTSWSFHPLESLTFIFPAIYGDAQNNYWGFFPLKVNTYYFGLLPFFLAPFAFINGANKKSVLWASAGGAILLIMAFGGNTPVYGLLRDVPVINLFRDPARFLYLFVFCAAFISGAAAHNLFGERPPARSGGLKAAFAVSLSVSASITAAAWLALSTGAAGALLSRLYTASMAHPLRPGFLPGMLSLLRTDVKAFTLAATVFYTAAALIVFKAPGRMCFAVFTAVLALHFADIYRAERPYINFLDADELVRPKSAVFGFLQNDRSIYRALKLDDRRLPNTNLFYNVEFLDGYHGLAPAKYEALAGCFKDIKLQEMLNVKYVAARDAGGRGAPALGTQSGFNVYMNRSPMERFYIAGRVRYFPDDRAVLECIRSGAFRPDDALIAGKPDPALGQGKPAGGRVKVELYSPDRIKLGVRAGSVSLLVISNFFYPSWRVFVNGAEKRLINVNYLVSGVKVEKGDNEVELRFDGSYIVAGIFTALAALLVYIAILIYGCRKTTPR